MPRTAESFAAMDDDARRREHKKRKHPKIKPAGKGHRTAKGVRFSLTFDEETWGQIETMAFDNKCSTSDAIRLLVEWGIEVRLGVE